MNNFELLSPAGTFECVTAAVQNGCSAVYAGADRLNARQNAENFTLAQLEEAVDYCHVRGVKLYVTVNILIKDNEISDFLGLVEKAYLMGADGIIVQDIGGASLIKRYFPDFYLLGSTQMTIHDKDGADFLYKNGIGRVIVSRELKTNEIARICESNAEIECFVHGAMCVCYSGQCLMSSLIGGRSGNRGMCAQPCRQTYGLYDGKSKIAEGNLLSMKDMCALRALPGLIEAGVKSFKIEGRMKSPEYVACVTSVYRKYIDMYRDSKENYSVSDKDIEALLAVFNRSGFSGGYYDSYKGRNMLTENKVSNTGVYIGKVSENKNHRLRFTAVSDVAAGDGIEVYAAEGRRGAYITGNSKAGEAISVNLDNPEIEKGALIYRTYDKKLMDALKASYEKDSRKTEAAGEFTAKKDKPVSLDVYCGGIHIRQEGDAPQPAQSAPLTEEEVVRRINKTGGTPFAFSEIKTAIDDGLYVSIAELNKLRRGALNELENAIKKNNKRQPKQNLHKNVTIIKGKAESRLTVMVRTKEQLEAASGFKLSRVYVDFPASAELLKMLKSNEVFRCLPHIERNSKSSETYDCDAKLYDGCLVRTYGQAERMLKAGRAFCVDYTLNIANCFSAGFWINKGCRSFCVSPEFGNEGGALPDLKKAEAVMYGKIPVMTTVQCPIGNFSNNLCGGGLVIASANDRYEIITNCDECYCQLLSKNKQKPGPQYDYLRIELSNESYSESKKVLTAFNR